MDYSYIRRNLNNKKEIVNIYEIGQLLIKYFKF